MPEFSDKDIRVQFDRLKARADEYLKDKEKAKALLKEAADKASALIKQVSEDAKKGEGPIGEVWAKVQLLINLFRDWSSGVYRAIPSNSIIAIVIALLYFVMPLDLIPDFIPVIGLVDDLAVIAYVFRQVSGDLDRYQAWKEGGTKE